MRFSMYYNKNAPDETIKSPQAITARFNFHTKKCLYPQQYYIMLRRRRRRLMGFVFYTMLLRN